MTAPQPGLADAARKRTLRQDELPASLNELRALHAAILEKLATVKNPIAAGTLQTNRDIVEQAIQTLERAEKRKTSALDNAKQPAEPPAREARPEAADSLLIAGLREAVEKQVDVEKVKEDSKRLVDYSLRVYVKLKFLEDSLKNEEKGFIKVMMGLSEELSRYANGKTELDPHEASQNLERLAWFLTWGALVSLNNSYGDITDAKLKQEIAHEGAGAREALDAAKMSHDYSGVLETCEKIMGLFFRVFGPPKKG